MFLHGFVIQEGARKPQHDIVQTMDEVDCLGIALGTSSVSQELDMTAASWDLQFGTRSGKITISS